MAFYVDGFVTPVPRKNRAKYAKLSRLTCKVWLECGALTFHECLADDVQPGKHTSFPQSVKLKRGEEVWFAWIIYKSRKHRDQVFAKAFADRRIVALDAKKMPFDTKRMYWGGFKSVVSGRHGAVE